MYVKDLDGAILEITDLEQAIKQANLYRKYKHLDKAMNKNERMQAYWQDLYDKLVVIKEKSS